MLKPTLLVGMVLLQCAMAQTPRNDGTNYKCLEPINALRVKYAHDYQIANMNELIYNERWEMALWERMYIAENWFCPKPTIHFYGSSVIFADILNDTYALDLLVSGHDITEISCYKHKCDLNGKDVLSVMVLHRNGTRAQHGVPGTKCYDTKPDEKTGLCSPSSIPSEYARKSMNPGRSRSNLWGKSRYEWYEEMFITDLKEKLFPEKHRPAPTVESRKSRKYDRKFKNPDKPKSSFLDLDIFKNGPILTSTFPRTSKPSRPVPPVGRTWPNDDIIVNLRKK